MFLLVLLKKCPYPHMHEMKNDSFYCIEVYAEHILTQRSIYYTYIIIHYLEPLVMTIYKWTHIDLKSIL